MPPIRPDALAERRGQILHAAQACFIKRGIRQTTMHDISAQAGISVGLIYRYFPSKEAVISGMADEHKAGLGEMVKQARQMPSLLEAIDVFFTCPCNEHSQEEMAGFLFDLFGEATRNPEIAVLVNGVLEYALEALTELIANAPEAKKLRPGLTPRACAELIVAVHDGSRGLELGQAPGIDASGGRRLAVARRLCELLFTTPGAVSKPATGKTKGKIRAISGMSAKGRSR